MNSLPTCATENKGSSLSLLQVENNNIERLSNLHYTVENDFPPKKQDHMTYKQGNRSRPTDESDIGVSWQVPKNNCKYVPDNREKDGQNN